MPIRHPWAATAGALLTVLVAGCGLLDPSPSASDPAPSGVAASSAPSTSTPDPTPSPSPTPEPEVEVPLAVVTGYTNRPTATTLDALRAAGPVAPCEATDIRPPVADPADCLPLDEIVAAIEADPTLVALLPPETVVPTVKVLPIDGADVFGNAEARGRPYPITGRIVGATPYRADRIRTLISLGDSCPDRGVAHAAITLGRGWDWVFGGGTADYTAVYPNPVPETFVGNGFNIVDAVPSGNAGAVAELVAGADVTVDDFECPVVDDWTVNEGVVFSIDPAVLPRLRDTYGVDVASLAANHLFDRGAAGFLQTLAKFEEAGIPTTGAGVDLDAALEPAYVDAAGTTFAFVGFNEIPPAFAEATADTPGVAWLRDANVTEAVGRARAAEADVIICVPQWWGGAEYHAQFLGDMRRQQEVFFDAGCDHVLGHGTHWSGPIEIAPTDDDDHRVTMVSHGNFLFGQEWSQQTQEGVILELAFDGTRLAQARLHPYIMLEQAQTNLTDPETDGLWVLNRIYEASGLPVIASP